MEKNKQDEQRVAGAHREPGDVADHSSSGEVPTPSEQQEGEVVGGMYVRKNVGAEQGSGETDKNSTEGGYGGQREFDDSEAVDKVQKAIDRKRDAA